MSASTQHDTTRARLRELLIDSCHMCVVLDAARGHHQHSYTVRAFLMGHEE